MPNSSEARVHRENRGDPIEFEVDGKPCMAYQGETIAAALLASGKKVFRRTPKRKEPRSMFCGMGVCFECIVTVNGVPNTRACVTLVEKGMKVETDTSGEEHPGARVEGDASPS